MLAICSLLSAAHSKYVNMMQNEIATMEDLLYRAIFEEMWIKLEKKSFDRQAKYTVDIKPSWAIAFHLEFSGTVNSCTYEGNLAQRICDKIHQHYATR